MRLASVEAAAAAIAGLNNRTLAGASQPLIVRFAESAQEKAERQRRREAQALQRGLSAGAAAAAATSGGVASPADLQQLLAALSLGGGLPAAPAPPAAPQLAGPPALSSVCIQGEARGRWLE